MSDQEGWDELDEFFVNDLGRHKGAYSKYYQHVMSGLKRLQEENQFCDISIKVGYRTFNAHKVVLASSCEYFQRMFSSGFQEAVKAEITMEGNSMIFAIIFEFIYTGNMKSLSQANAVDVLEMACYIQFDQAIDMCRKYLMNQFARTYHYHLIIPLQTAYEITRLAEDYESLSDLVREGKEYIKREFFNLAEKEEFCENTTAECLEVCLGEETIIKRNTKEEDLVSLVRRWLKHSWDSRKQNAPCLLKKLRLGLLTDDSLTALLDEMQDVQECKEILDEVCNLKDPLECDFTGGTMEYLYPHYFAPRSTITTLVAVGGKRGRNVYLQEGDLFSRGYWMPLHQIPQLPTKRRLHCSVVARGKIYVAGGLEENVQPADVIQPTDENLQCVRVSLYDLSRLSLRRRSSPVITWKPTRQSFWQYDGRKDEWQALPLLQRPRHSFALVHMDNCLFFIGGKGEGNRVLQEVDCYHLGNQNWQSIEALPEPVLNPSAVVFGGRVLVYGQSVTYLHSASLHVHKVIK